MLGCCKVPTKSLVIDRIYYRHTHRDILFSFTTLHCVILKPNKPLSCTCFTSLFTTCQHALFIKRCFGKTTPTTSENPPDSNLCLVEQLPQGSNSNHALVQFLIEKVIPITNQEHHRPSTTEQSTFLSQQHLECCFCLEPITNLPERTKCRQCCFVVHDACWIRWLLENCTISDMSSPCPICTSEVMNKRRYESFYDLSSHSVNIVVYKRRSNCV